MWTKLYAVTVRCASSLRDNNNNDTDGFMRCKKLLGYLIVQSEIVKSNEICCHYRTPHHAYVSYAFRYVGRTNQLLS